MVRLVLKCHIFSCIDAVRHTVDLNLFIFLKINYMLFYVAYINLIMVKKV